MVAFGDVGTDDFSPRYVVGNVHLEAVGEEYC